MEDTSTCTSETKSITFVSDAEDTTSESEDDYHATMLDNDSFVDEIVATGTTHYESNKNSTAAKKI